MKKISEVFGSDTDNNGIQRPNALEACSRLPGHPRAEVNKVLGGTLIALAALLGNSGCGGKVSVVTDESHLTPPDKEDAGNNNDGDVYLDADVSGNEGSDNDANQACNTMEIFRSDGKSPSGTIPRGATNIPLLCFDLYPGCQSGDINELHFNQYGDNDGKMEVALAEVYPWGARLTPMKKGDDANFNGLKLYVEKFNGDGKGSYHNYCLYGNLDKDATPGNTYSYSLIKPDSSFMTNHPKVIMDNPVNGDSFSVANVETGTILAEEAASVPQVYAEHGQYGHIAVIALQQGLTTDGGRLQRVSLKIDGTCDTSTIKNLNLTEGNIQLANKVDAVNEMGMVHFPVLNNPYNFSPNTGSTLYLDAEQNCKPGEYISVYLDEPSDLYVENLTYGFGETVQGNLCGNGSGCKPSIVYIK